jgi:phosphate-selective porin OprO/OprP
LKRNLLAAFLCPVLSLSLPLIAESAPPQQADETSAVEASDSIEEVEKKDEPAFTWNLGGRLQLDYAWFDDERDDGGEMRRGRLEVKGKAGEDWGYKIQFEFAGDEPEIRDGFLRYKGLGSGSLIFGNYKQPSSLEALTSSKHTTFLEGGLVTDLAEGRRMGVGYSYEARNVVLMASLYGDEANGAVEGNGVIGRGVWIPMNTGDEVVHLGGSVSRSEPQTGEVRIRVRPDSHVTDERILDTGTIGNVDSVLRTGVEGAVVLNRFSAQAEYVQSDYSRSAGDPDLTFDGWYAYGSWFLTPDRRNYDGREAAFDKVSPTLKGGAWEVALRFQTMELSDQDITGGSADAWTVALNWYPNAYLRFMANYSMVDTDDVAGNDDPNVFQVRAQISF